MNGASAYHYYVESINMKFRELWIFWVFLCFSTSCAVQAPGPGAATAPVVIYKTKKDYRNQVSVKLSEDKKTITAYPASSDVSFQKPFELADGYLLKRMVGNAFLSLSIEEYAGSTHKYTADELLELVVDIDPYLEIFECSACTTGDTAAINLLIREKKLRKCKSLR